jgi:membrane-associated phospholipid phosphatase
VHDVTVRAWEHWLFGGDISQTWWQTAPSVFWSTVFHGAYFAYYPIIALPVITFLIMGRPEAARRSVLWLLATYVITYVVFVLYPVAGPYYEFPRPAAWFVDNFPARLVYGTLANGSAFGAAFPSSHVAATIVATAAALRGSRVVGWCLVVPAALLTVGVVYCQMHYAVDALAGIAVASAVVVAGVSWERRSRGQAPATTGRLTPEQSAVLIEP